MTTLDHIPAWIREDALALEDYYKLLGNQRDDDDDPLDPMYLMNFDNYSHLETYSQTKLSECLKEEDQDLYKKFRNETEWGNFVKFVSEYKEDILGRGYETPQQCYFAYKHYLESIKRNPDLKLKREWDLPHVRTMTHPKLELIKFPLPDEEITKEFKAYVYYSVLDELQDTTYLDIVTADEEMFDWFLEYCRFYQLWYLGWNTMVETFCNMTVEYKFYGKGQKPYEEHHEVPITASDKLSKAQKAVKEAKRAENDDERHRRDSLERWAHSNRQEALRYLIARRHHEHDRKFEDPTLPEFNAAPPKGMERIARHFRGYHDALQKNDERHEYLLFGDEPEEYDYLALLEEEKNKGYGRANKGVLPRMEDLYEESRYDQEVINYMKRREQRFEANSKHAAYWPVRRHKLGKHTPLEAMFGNEDGKYLTRLRQEEYGPLPEGQLLPTNSDDILARISTLSLAEVVSNTDHQTEMERRRLLLDMDQVVRYNRKLVGIYQDVIHHIGPQGVAPPTEWDFAGAQEYLARKKLECEKWERVAVVRAEEKERECLFSYYEAVRQFIHNTARDIHHEARSTIHQLTQFVETVRKADPELVASWFEDAVAPSCLQYIEDLRDREKQIEDLMAAVEKVKVYKTLMSYKDTDEGKLFDDDIYHDIVRLRREIEALSDNVQQKELKVETTEVLCDYTKQQAHDTGRSAEKYVSQAHALEVYSGSLKRNVEAERETAQRLRNEIEELEIEHKKNEKELKAKGITCPQQKPEDMALIKDTKELLEATNTKLLSELNLLDREIAEYEDLVAKKSERVDKKKTEVAELESSTYLYRRQKVVKEDFLTRIGQENKSEKEKLAKTLAKNIRVKTGAVCTHYNDIYWDIDMNNFRGQRDLAEVVGKEYSETFDQYHETLETLTKKVEEYRSLKERVGREETVLDNATKDAKMWKLSADTAKRRNMELSRECVEKQRELKQENHTKDQLAELVARTERRAGENEKFRQQAQAAIISARNATAVPNDSEFTMLRERVRGKSFENEKLQLKIKKVRQDMRKKANNFRNLLITLK